MRKRWCGIGIVLFCLILTVFPVAALAAGDVVEPTKEFYVADYAKVLSSETEKWIVKQNQDLYKRTGAQIVVVTVDFLGGMEIEDYAYKLFNKWGIGSKEKNNGVLLLLAIGEDNYWCVQGKGLENSLDSGAIGDILYDNLEPDFAKQKYNAGVKKTFDVLYAQVDAISKNPAPTPTATVKRTQTPYAPSYGGYTSGSDGSAGLIFLLLFFSIGIIAIAIRGGARIRDSANNYPDMPRTGSDDPQTHHVPHDYVRSHSDDDDIRHSWSSSSSSSHSSSSHSTGSGFHSGGSSSGSSGSGRFGGGGSGGSSGSNSGGGGSTRGGGAGRR